MPHQVYFMEQAISSSREMVEDLKPIPANLSQNRNNTTSIVLPIQGHTLSSDLLITSTKIFSDASWNNTKIPGRNQCPTTGLGVFIQVVDGSSSYSIMIQASMDQVSSPLVAEAEALCLTAAVGRHLNLQEQLS